MELTELTFFSDPGVYEIETEAGPRYELTLPESLIDTGRLLIDQMPGVADPDGGRELRVFDVDMKIGEAGTLLLDDESSLDAPPREVRTRPVTRIVRVD